MLHPDMMYDYMQARHQQELENAERRRLYQMQLNRKWLKAMEGVGDSLITLGQRLRAVSQSNSATPAFGKG